MATSNGTDRGEPAPSLIDDPDVLRVLVERMVQALLEEQMSAHVGAERSVAAIATAGNHAG